MHAKCLKSRANERPKKNLHQCYHLYLDVAIVITEAPQHQEKENCKDNSEASCLRVPFLSFPHIDFSHVPRLDIRIERVNWRSHWVWLSVSEVNEKSERLFNHEFKDWIRVGQALFSANAWRQECHQDCSFEPMKRSIKTFDQLRLALDD